MAMLAAVVLVPALAPTSAGAQSTGEFTFSPASPVALPVDSNDFVTASSPGAPACESLNATITVTVADIQIEFTDTQRADGSLDVYFAPFTPGVYTVTAECVDGPEIAVIAGSVTVTASDGPDQPTLSASPSQVVQGGVIDIQADECVFTGDRPGTVGLWTEGPLGQSYQELVADSEGTATAYLGDFPPGTYTFHASCIGPDSTLAAFVYPQEPSVVVVSSVIPDPGLSPTPTTPGSPASSDATAAAAVVATPSFTG